jgi:hypothetical protein
MVATSPSPRLHPERTLGETEERAAASGTNLLIVPAVAHLVREPELPLDHDHVAHHHVGCVRLLAAPAPRLLVPRARVPVEADAELRRTLKDVEQLAER